MANMSGRSTAIIASVILKLILILILIAQSEFKSEPSHCVMAISLQPQQQQQAQAQLHLLATPNSAPPAANPSLAGAPVVAPSGLSIAGLLSAIGASQSPQQAQAQPEIQTQTQQQPPIFAKVAAMNGNQNGKTQIQPQIQAASREMEKQIVDRILGEGYDKRIRPAGTRAGFNASKPGSDGPTIVKVNTLVRSISKIDDVTMEYSVQLSLRQEWTDDRLAFGKMAQYKNYGLNSITLTEQERLWKPDLFFRNEKEGHFHKIILPNVLLRINGEGEVLYSIRISLVLACPMDLKYYPLDKQNCTIEMASYGYLDEDLKFLWKEINPVQISKPLNLPRFTLENHETAYCTSRTTTGAYSCLRIDLVFKREFSYYLIQIYIPCCMLVIVSWVSFWLDPNAIPARVSLGVTTLLTMATQISGINASLPPVSYTKAIDVWTGVCLTFVFGALLEFALVNYASRSDQHKREMMAKMSHTQQMRWREATAAAAAAGVAPPTSPPIDENSPSALRPPIFFPAFMPLTTAQGPVAIGPQTAGGRVSCLRRPTANSSTKLVSPNPVANGTGQPVEQAQTPQRRKNWCRMWLAKFPTRSKRIDVISRIFFPLQFALFNMVYWTTYLFREEDSKS